MQGYERSEEVSTKLIAALRDAIYANPDQRLGQLLINVSRRDDGSQSDSWNRHDEQWIEDLRRSF